MYGGEGDDQRQDGDDLLRARHGLNLYYGGAGADNFTLMKEHIQNIIGDFNPNEGDKLLIHKGHIDRIKISIAGRGNQG